MCRARSTSPLPRRRGCNTVDRFARTARLVPASDRRCPCQPVAMKTQERLYSVSIAPSSSLCTGSASSPLLSSANNGMGRSSFSNITGGSFGALCMRTALSGCASSSSPEESVVRSITGPASFVVRIRRAATSRGSFCNGVRAPSSESPESEL